jgi:glycogen debranching enzyme
MSHRSILLRLTDCGAPVNEERVDNGVLILPSLPLPENPDSSLFKLVFQITAASPITRNGTLYVNVPKKGDEFIRDSYAKYPLQESFDKDIEVAVELYCPGAYTYYIGYYHDNQQVFTEKYYFNVPPNLLINGQFLPFNNINIESVVSKWIGPVENWPRFFELTAKKGYNMIHFTPLQKRGSSDLPFSIYDQLSFDDGIFKDNDQAKSTIKSIFKKNNMLSLTDVIFNHTAENSSWLPHHPEAGYNATTAPHLTSAIELEDSLLQFSQNLSNYNLPSTINNIDDLNQVMEKLKSEVIEKLNLWQFYVFNKQEIIDSLKKLVDENSKVSSISIPEDIKSNLTQLAQFVLQNANENDDTVFTTRYANKLNPSKLLGLIYGFYDSDQVDYPQIEVKANSIIDEINSKLYEEYNRDKFAIIEQLYNRIKFLRIDDNGPKLGAITKKHPIIENYFTKVEAKDGKVYSLANNGWIWGGNPLVDFASNKSKAYLRREVIVWSDCVKLRYGESKDDSPFAWDLMTRYVQLCASVFDGFRLDNAHSTPIHVGEALLDAARKVNPNLYVVAELFSGSEEIDKLFVERLGINSLIREAMQAWNVQELSRLVHKHGGRPIGSLTWLPLDNFAYPANQELGPTSCGIDTYTQTKIPKVLSQHAPHALFMDCTHDNETPAQKRTPEDTLPNAALVAFCSSAIGSVHGYDEIYPKLVDVVSETRLYNSMDNGIGFVKLKLNAIRKSLAEESEDILRDHEMYIHHEGQYITIQRLNARTGKGWFLIARTKFSNHEEHQILSPCILGGTKVKNEFAYTLKVVGEHKEDEKYLTGIPVKVEEIPFPKVEDNGKESIIKVDDSFVPGSIAVFSTQVPNVDIKLDEYIKEGVFEATEHLDLYDLNEILYRCESEERDASGGYEGVYNIPGYGNLIYAGLEGWNIALRDVIWQNNLGHPICDHLREGEWALDYVVDRLNKYVKNSSNLGKFQDWLKNRIDAIRKVPYFLRPHYFALVVGIAYEAARFRVLRNLDESLQVATNFVQRLALTSVQMIGRMHNTSLQPLEQVPCIAAGLPHFSADYMRCWGRDVFISFRGLMLVPGRFEDAKNHILGFAKTLKHGLIPNLLDAGRNPRYNARDAAWFFLQAIQDYTTFVPNGVSILDEKVKRRFPLDDTYVTYEDPLAFSYETSIRDIIYEILARHAKGIKYREANAGPQLDSQMKDEGFNVEVNIDWDTGLVHGGSQYNCGTWMDKMGESVKAGNKGFPGTPRDGAAIELQGLLKSTLRWVNQLNQDGLFPYTEVTKNDGTKISLKAWEKLLKDNFETCFYIPNDASEDSQFKVDSSLINRRGIYKDLYKSGKAYEDYQLRPNFSIAMTVAPELFTVERAYDAISIADKVIRGPVGMRTLDPSDWNYRPNYYNSEDSEDFATSKGRNYHQGPEWVWNSGYFFRAFVLFSLKSGQNYKTIAQQLSSRLQGNVKWIKESPWAGLTELTNKDGALCNDSSPTQAWSSSCLLDLYYDFEHYKKA